MAARKKTTSRASKPVVKTSKPKAKPSRAKPSQAKSATKESVVRGPTKAKKPTATAAKASKKTRAGKSPAAASRGTSSRESVKSKVAARVKTTRVTTKTAKPEAKPVQAAPAVPAARAPKVSPAPAAPPVVAAAAPEAPAAKTITGASPVSARAPAPATAQKPVVPRTAPAEANPGRDEQNGDQRAMKTNGNRHGFKLNEFVVYPAHGVGQIVSMEEQEVAGFKLELFVINFVKDKMTLRVPTSKVAAVGMRKLSDPDAARRSLEILTGRARIKRTMWSRRAQEYESKINSGDINAIAEVVRDLFRSEAQPEQSYSERQLYEAALDRMMREIAAVHRLTETEALKMIETQLKKNVKRAPKPDAVEGEAEADEADIEEAA